MVTVLYSVIIFLVVTAAMAGVLLPIASSRSKKRLSAVVDDGGYAANKQQADWSEKIVKLASPLAKLSLPTDGWEQSPLRLRFMHAGYRGTGPIAIYFAAKTGLAILFPGLVYLYLLMAGTRLDTSIQLAILLGAATVGYYLSNIVLARLVFVRQRELFEAFPDAADLLLVCIESGLGLDAALVKVTEEIRTRSEILSEEFHLVNLELRAGNSRESPVGADVRVCWRPSIPDAGPRELHHAVRLLPGSSGVRRYRDHRPRTRRVIPQVSLTPQFS